MNVVLPCALMLILMQVLEVEGQRSAKWSVCQCKWAPWHSWTTCTKSCWGVQMRKRQVWKKNTPFCSGFEVCDKGKGALGLQRCNKKCTHGRYDKKERKCICPSGLYGTCCDQVVTCGKPPAVLNSKPQETAFNFSDTMTYECKKGYKTKGDPEIVCGDTGWNGTTPQCVSEDPCEGVNCPLNEKCKAEGDTYTCFCPKDASCNLDLAPEVVRCPESKNITTPDRRILYKWKKPEFKDAHGEKLVIESNYPDNQFRFPWQRSQIQYTALKKSNGQRSECKFYVDVKPIPCEEIEVPNKGYVACTNWNTNYGRFCMFGCTGSFEIPEEFDPRTWAVCGSSGQWTPSNLLKECQVTFGGGGDPKKGTLGNVDECLTEKTQENIKVKFLELFKKSDFRDFCFKKIDECNTKNVDVKCWNSGLLGGSDDLFG